MSDILKPSGTYLIFGDYSFTVLESSISESLDDLFLITCYSYYEGLSNDPFHDQSSDFLLGGDVLYCLNSPDRIREHSKNISVSAIKGNNPSGSFAPDKVFRGIISSLSYIGPSYVGDTGSAPHVKTLSRRHYYRIQITSPLYKLSLNNSYRIFTDISALDVIKSTLSRYSGFLGKELDFTNIYNTHHNSEYISQYNESDLCFLKRICHNNGIYFYEDADRIYFYDSIYHTPGLSRKSSDSSSGGVGLSSYPFNANPNNHLTYHCIYGISRDFSLNPHEACVSSSDPCIPLREHREKSVDTFSEYDERRADMNKTLRSLQTYHKHELNPSFSDIDVFNNKIKLRANLLYLSGVFKNSLFYVKSNIPTLRINDILEIEDFDGSLYFGSHNNQGNRYKIVGIRHHLEDNSLSLGVSDKAGGDISVYFNELTLIPKDIPFIPSVEANPIVSGYNIGIVTGESDNIDSERNSIYTDDYGRIKVRFSHNIVQSSIDSNSSPNPEPSYTRTCFLRCVTPISGISSGFIAIPRVGDEVVVGFLEGDCDKPVVLGSLYNNYNRSLLGESVKQDYHKTSLSSRTIGRQSVGMTEISMSNLLGQEKLYVQAEKDYEELVKQNFKQHVGGNKSSSVTGGYIENIALAHMQNIGLGKDVNVGGEYVTIVGASKDTVVGLSNTLNVGVSNMVNVAENSSESIGGNKTVSVNGDLKEVVNGSRKEVTTGNVSRKTGGIINETSDSGINIVSKKHYSVNVEENLDYYSEQNMTLNAKKHITFEAESADFELKSEFSLKAEDKVEFKIGDAEISSDGSSITFKVSSVEVSIDSKGLKLKSGKLTVE